MLMLTEQEKDKVDANCDLQFSKNGITRASICINRTWSLNVS